MNVWPRDEESSSDAGRLWRWIRWLFLVVAIVALGYSGWIYFDGYWHGRRASEAFNRAREAQRGGIRPQGGTEPFAARLSIPRLRLTAMVEEGVDEDTLRRAAGHIPETALPGQPGNVGVAAHRDMLFRKLKGIRQHDRIMISTLKRDYTYEVISTSIVNPDDRSVLAPTRGQQTLTLVTCYPFYFIGHAPKRFIVHARQIEENAQSKDMSLVAQNPRKESQTQEDRRVIAERSQEKGRPVKAEVEARTARPATVQADAARVQREAQQPEANLMGSAGQSELHPPEEVTGEKIELRQRILEQVTPVVAVRDTPRGLVATIPDVDFNGPALRGLTMARVRRISAIVSAYAGLRIEVEGHIDTADTEALSERRAEAVRSVLVENGLTNDSVAARGFGNTRLLVSNANAAGRQQNRRVEIVISGDPIGDLAFWDHSYALMRR